MICVLATVMPARSASVIVACSMSGVSTGSIEELDDPLLATDVDEGRGLRHRGCHWRE
jgi:hypothetical protein